MFLYVFYLLNWIRNFYPKGGEVKQGEYLWKWKYHDGHKIYLQKERIMKKLLLVTLFLILSVSLVEVAMATSKPPAKLCLHWSPQNFYSVLSIKSFGGNVTIFGEEKIKYYAIHGEATNQGSFSAPVSGTGHMDGDIFHFSLTGSAEWTDGRVWSYHIEGFWNVVNNTGTGSYQAVVRNTGTGTADIGEYNFAITLGLWDCLTIVVPYSEDINLESAGRTPFGGP